MSDLRDHSLLAVFAHPDDESLACGGLLALCAERGARVSLLCLTRGEHGPGTGGRSPEHGRVGGGDLDADSRGSGLGERRAAELAAAARILGVGHVDVLDHEDGMLPWLAAEALASDIRDAIRRSGADVVVTFDEDGLYWHPDHVAVHERTTDAVASLGPDGPALRYVSLPPGAMRAVADAAPGGPILGVEDFDAFGASAPPPSFVLDVAVRAGHKLAALRCHRSQVEGGPLDRIDAHDAARLLGVEHYRHAEVGRPGAAFIDAFATASPAEV